MATHYVQSNRVVKRDRVAAQRLARWLLVLGVLAGTVWLMTVAFQRKAPGAPAIPADRGEPVSPPAELLLPMPRRPVDPQFLAANSGPTAGTVRTGQGVVLRSGGTSEFKI